MSSRDTDSNPPHDVERLLTPIRGNNPAGDDLRYLGLYDEIREARRSDETFEQGDWKRQPKLADWKKVVLLTTDALANHTKDLLVGAWFCEALVIVHGLTGLRDGLKLILGLHERFWENLYPEIDAGDTEARANVLSLMDRQLSLAITKASNQISGPQNEEVNELLNECRTEIRALERVIDEKYSGEAPGLPRLKKSLDNMVKLLDRQVKPKRVLEHEVEVAAESAWLDVIGSESAARSPARSTGAQTVCFTAYYPVELKPEVWYTLLVYVHVPAAIDAVHSDSQGRLGPRAKAHERSRAIATETIARGTEIVAVPEMRGLAPH
jgi:hypothetical protein